MKRRLGRTTIGKLLFFSVFFAHSFVVGMDAPDKDCSYYSGKISAPNDFKKFHEDSPVAIYLLENGKFYRQQLGRLLGRVIKPDESGSAILDSIQTIFSLDDNQLGTLYDFPKGTTKATLMEKLQNLHERLSVVETQLDADIYIRPLNDIEKQKLIALDKNYFESATNDADLLSSPVPRSAIHQGRSNPTSMRAVKQILRQIVKSRMSIKYSIQLRTKDAGLFSYNLGDVNFETLDVVLSPGKDDKVKFELSFRTANEGIAVWSGEVAPDQNKDKYYFPIEMDSLKYTAGRGDPKSLNRRTFPKQIDIHYSPGDKETFLLINRFLQPLLIKY